jgi:hypothetical protein
MLDNNIFVEFVPLCPSLFDKKAGKNNRRIATHIINNVKLI